MSKFEAAIPYILKHEGSFVNDPADPGGPTNYGISLRFARTEAGEFDLDGDGDVDLEDIRALTSESATKAYRERVWDLQGYARIRGQTIATKVFDMAVNMGPKMAHKILQRALVEYGIPVVVDGILGPRTIQAANYADQDHLLTKIVALQSDFYRDLAARKPALGKFLPQWLRRATWPLTSRGPT